MIPDSPPEQPAAPGWRRRLTVLRLNRWRVLAWVFGSLAIFNAVHLTLIAYGGVAAIVTIGGLGASLVLFASVFFAVAAFVAYERWLAHGQLPWLEWQRRHRILRDKPRSRVWKLLSVWRALALIIGVMAVLGMLEAMLTIVPQTDSELKDGQGRADGVVVALTTVGHAHADEVVSGYIVTYRYTVGDTTHTDSSYVSATNFPDVAMDQDVEVVYETANPANTYLKRPQAASESEQRYDLLALSGVVALAAFGFIFKPLIWPRNLDLSAASDVPAWATGLGAVGFHLTLVTTLAFLALMAVLSFGLFYESVFGGLGGEVNSPVEGGFVWCAFGTIFTVMIAVASRMILPMWLKMAREWRGRDTTAG